MPIKKVKCNNCNSKVKGINIITNKCQCNLVFCSKCRLPEDHACTFDHRAKATTSLERNLIKVEGDRVQNRL